MIYFWCRTQHSFYFDKLSNGFAWPIRIIYLCSFRRTHFRKNVAALEIIDLLILHGRIYLNCPIQPGESERSIVDSVEQLFPDVFLFK